MSNQQTARIYFLITALLGIAGLFIKGRLLGLMNTDIILDLVRVTLALYLFYAAFISKNRLDPKIALLVTGVTYLTIGLIGFFDPTLGGLLPSGLTWFDIAFQIIAGAYALYAGIRKIRRTIPVKFE